MWSRVFSLKLSHGYASIPDCRRNSIGQGVGCLFRFVLKLLASLACFPHESGVEGEAFLLGAKGNGCCARGHPDQSASMRPEAE